MYSAPENDDKFIQIIKIIKLGKNLGRNEKTYVGIPTLDIGIPMSNIGIPTWVFQLKPRKSEAREPTTMY